MGPAMLIYKCMCVCVCVRGGWCVFMCASLINWGSFIASRFSHIVVFIIHYLVFMMSVIFDSSVCRDVAEGVCSR